MAEQSDSDALVAASQRVVVVRHGETTWSAHGAPLGKAGAASAREALGWAHRPFEIPGAVNDHWRQGVSARARARTEWRAAMDRYRIAHPDLAAEHERVQSGRLPDGWQQAVPRFETGTRIATRRASGQALNALAAAVRELVGGAADLAPSTLTYLHGHDDVGPRRFAGRNVHFGVREHAMGAMLNGMAAHGGLRVYGASALGWRDLVDEVVGLSRFGASAPATVLYPEMGITPGAVADRVRHLLARGPAATG
jgi:transketolase